MLAHYAERGEAARDAWQDRVMECDGCTTDELVRLHGQLLAHQSIELNVGVAVRLQPRALLDCYRVTAAGLRAVKRARERPEDGDELRKQAA